MNLPSYGLLERIEVIANRKQTPDPVDATAVLGTKKPPALTVTQALEVYWTRAKDKTFGKSDDKKRRWEYTRKKALRNFVSVDGDKPMNEITADEMLEFRSYWQERIETGGLTANSANRDLIQLLKTVNTMKWPGLDFLLDGLAFKEGEKSERPLFGDEWIRTKLLAPDALLSLKPEARAILLGMINTGYRPSEAACTAPDQFCLDANIRHMIIKPREGRAIKNKNSKRVIPLDGVSLETMRLSERVPIYRVSDATLSATMNKYL